MDKASFSALFTEETNDLPSPRTEGTGESFGRAYADIFYLYFQLLIEYNQKINLTAVTEPGEVIRKHFVDSLLPYRLGLIEAGTSVVDVGSGAGFPGVPLAVALPSCRFLLLEPIGKRADFLQTVVSRLGLTNCTVIKMRAEDACGKAGNLRESCDYAVSRAVSRLRVLCEYCLPFVRLGGKMLALKSVAAGDEISEAGRAVELLGGGNARIMSAPLLQGEDTAPERNVVVVDKVLSTPAVYPRRAGVPEKKPL